MTNDRSDGANPPATSPDITIGERTRQRTVNEVLDRYQAERFPGLKEKTRKDYIKHIRVLRAEFGSRIGSEISRAELIAFMNVSTSRYRRNKLLAVLSSALTAAVEWEWISHNPCRGIPRHPAKPRTRFVTLEEFDRFRSTVQDRPAVLHMVELARYTGRKQSELLDLRWTQVDEKKWLINFRDRKHGHKEEFSATPPVRGVLKRCRSNGSSKTYVIGNEEGRRYTEDGFRSVWQRQINRWVDSGNSGFTFHDLQYTYRIDQESTGRKITFVPTVFQIPQAELERDLVAVMMPFAAEFNPVFDAMRKAADDCGLRCLRVSDIWEEAAIIQEIFNLLYRANIVIVDFTRRNANVMYETGIAHTLGKSVVPITQSMDDIPFDIKHHRILHYLPNREGLDELRSKLAARLGYISGRTP
jgi:integrase